MSAQTRRSRSPLWRGLVEVDQRIVWTTGREAARERKGKARSNNEFTICPQPRWRRPHPRRKNNASTRVWRWNTSGRFFFLLFPKPNSETNLDSTGDSVGMRWGWFGAPLSTFSNTAASRLSSRECCGMIECFVNMWSASSRTCKVRLYDKKRCFCRLNYSKSILDPSFLPRPLKNSKMMIIKWLAETKNALYNSLWFYKYIYVYMNDINKSITYINCNPTQFGNHDRVTKKKNLYLNKTICSDRVSTERLRWPGNQMGYIKKKQQKQLFSFSI